MTDLERLADAIRNAPSHRPDYTLRLVLPVEIIDAIAALIMSPEMRPIILAAWDAKSSAPNNGPSWDNYWYVPDGSDEGDK